MENSSKEDHHVVQISDPNTGTSQMEHEHAPLNNDEIQVSPRDREEVSIDNVDLRALDNEVEVCLEHSQTDPGEVRPNKPWNHFRWLQLDTSVKFNLAGTDFSPKIEIEAIPSGRTFHHRTNVKREEKSGRLIPDQKIFILLNSCDQPLLELDYSTDLKSFHVMEPGSQRFIAFFTLPAYPFDEKANPGGPCKIQIHNVIDEEIYVIDSLGPSHLSIPIKSVNGEEMAVIMRPHPKWTESQPGLMTLHFSGDEREGLTCRERAILLGLFLALGITHWKRSTVGIYTVYLLSAILSAFLVLIIYIACRNDSTTSTRDKITPGKFIPA